MTKDVPRRNRARRLIGLLTAGACLAAIGLASAGPAAAAPPRHYPVGDLGTAVANFLTSPDKVGGANDFNCRPSRSKPYPVVLVHATFVNLGTNWATIAPTLANAGYCVFAFNYGMHERFSTDRVGGLTDIPQSAQVMRDFVDKVLRATRASKVDVVGHSQGGMMPNYYLKRLGGAPKVHTFVGLAPSNHGTTLNGLVTLGQQLNLLGLVNNAFAELGLAGLQNQMIGSQFQTELFADGDTVPGPRYVVLETTKDTVVTPYTNAFLRGPDVTNILIQDQCPADPVGHVGMFHDSPVIQNILNQLGPASSSFKPVCRDYGLPL